MSSRATRLTLTALCLTGLGVLGACGDDARTTTPSTAAPTGTGPATVATGEPNPGSAGTTPGTYAIVPDAAVTTGFRGLSTLLTTTAARPATVTQADLDLVEQAWHAFEGTVKRNDADLYLRAEEALDAFFAAGKAKDGATMTTAAGDFAKVADAYLAAHP